MPTISVIVPVYNAVQYLEECVSGIVNQSFCDIEILLVDDGSTDESERICEQWAEKDNRIRVFHQDNRGASSARNLGIKNARGQYLAFCDSDDLVSEYWLERMLQYAGEDVLPIGAYCSKKEDLSSYKELNFKPGIKMPIRYYWEFQKEGIAGFLCNALYCTKIVRENSLFLPERKKIGDYNEDLSFALAYVSNIKNIVYTGTSDYFYNTHDGSLSRKGMLLYFDKYAEKYRLWESFINSIYGDNFNKKQELAETYLYHFLTALNYQVDCNKFDQFRYIALSPELQTCIRVADCSKENQFVIRCIQKKKTITMWCFLQASKMKGRLLK